MIPYMVRKLAPNSSHLTRGLVKSVPGRDYFRAAPSQNGDKYVTSASPPIVELVSPLTGGEQISRIGKFFNAKQKSGQDPHAFYHQFNSTVTTLEMAFDQPIPKMLVHARFLDALLPEYEIQKTATFEPKVTGDGGTPEGLEDEGGALKSRSRGKGQGGEAGARVRRYGRKGRGEADEAKEKEASKG